MSVQLSIAVPDDLMEWLTAAAERHFRTPEGHVLWLVSNARGESRRGADSEARRALSAELQKLYEDAGAPSFRMITERIKQQGGNASHTTVYGAIRGTQLSSLATMESIVAALDGNVEHFRALWVRARTGLREKTETEE